MSANTTTFSKPVDTEIKDVSEQVSTLSEQIGKLQPTIFEVGHGTTVTKNVATGAILFTGHSSVATFKGIYFILSSSIVIALMDSSVLSVSISNRVLSITNNASSGTATCSLR